MGELADKIGTILLENPNYRSFKLKRREAVLSSRSVPEEKTKEVRIQNNSLLPHQRINDNKAEKSVLCFEWLREHYKHPCRVWVYLAQNTHSLFRYLQMSKYMVEYKHN